MHQGTSSGWDHLITAFDGPIQAATFQQETAYLLPV
jgi:hypothetical protein